VQYIEHIFQHVICIKFIVGISALGKSGSFGFAEGSALCVGAKPNVLLVRLAKIVLKKCGSAKKIKHEAMGCRVGKSPLLSLLVVPMFQ